MCGAAMNTRILIVEDHALLAQSLQFALEDDGYEVEVAADISPEAVVKAADRFRPAIVLLDLDLGDEGSSLPIIPPLRDIGACVVMVTGEENRARLGECVNAGAMGIVPKSAPFGDLVSAVREAAELRSLLPKPDRDALLAEMRRQHAEAEKRLAAFSRLTMREKEVLAGLCDGKSAETMATEAFVSLATIRSQIRTLLQKLGVNSQIGAVAMARRAGWELDRD